MANKWEYRRTDVYWMINQETRLMKRVANQGTVDLVAPLGTPRQLDKMRQQYWARTARRYPARALYVQHLEMRDFYISGPVVTDQATSGAMTPTAAAAKVVSKSLGGAFT
jgi:hypothetical protein